MSERDILTCKGGCGKQIVRGKDYGRQEWIYIHRDMAFCPTCYADQHEKAVKKQSPYKRDIVNYFISQVKEDDKKRLEARKKRT